MQMHTGDHILLTGAAQHSPADKILLLLSVVCYLKPSFNLFNLLFTKLTLPQAGRYNKRAIKPKPTSGKTSMCNSLMKPLVVSLNRSPRKTVFSHSQVEYKRRLFFDFLINISQKSID